MKNKFQGDAPGMRGERSRNESGPLRAKRGDTEVGTIESQYGIDLGVRSDMRWDTYKKLSGVESINDLINGA